MDKEEFRPIEGYPGYLVSNLGRVMSVRRKSGPRVLSLHASRYGYMQVMVCFGGCMTSLYVSRLVLAAFEGYPADPWLCVARHLDGDLSNCSLDNLVWVVCETTVDYDPSVSHRRGVLKPDFTREKMSAAKFNQSEETIEKQRVSRKRRYGMRRCDYE